ncbi:hypothetical protein [Natrinema sp. SYSU A 869]|uniref:hypothetical protein n=1 Tax=Natrinema sp. SYSU A 869 TaxID=2871694 RepID=UPI001CA3B6BF|nr:hypothetical protein [Natrinema sp. SYSU A 869]
MRLAVNACDTSVSALLDGTGRARSGLHRSVLAARSETDTIAAVSVGKRGRGADTLRDIGSNRLKPTADCRLHAH